MNTSILTAALFAFLVVPLSGHMNHASAQVTENSAAAGSPAPAESVDRPAAPQEMEENQAQTLDERQIACQNGTAGGRFICFGRAAPVTSEAEPVRSIRFNLGSGAGDTSRPKLVLSPRSDTAQNIEQMKEDCYKERAERAVAGLTPDGPACAKVSQYENEALRYQADRPAPEANKSPPWQSSCTTDGFGSTQCGGQYSRSWGTSEEARQNAEKALKDMFKDD